ncbi:MAG: histidine phosphatase family protein [Clostridia bacterium]|nr:histidine phosphatase family protein [Clostridia bacterium]
MKLLLTRHGQTDWNVAGKIQGRTDIELNETGIKQAERTRDNLAKEKIDLIMTSPLKRARKTAEIIAGKRNIPIIVEEEIMERYFGKFEGKTSLEFDFDEIWNYKLNKQYEDAESIKELFGRVKKFLEKIKTEYKDKTILIVTHGGVTVPIRATLEGIPEGMEVLRGFGIDNCEVKQYEL